MRDSSFHDLVDLTGAKIEGELHLASQVKDENGEYQTHAPTWHDKSRLVLRNAWVKSLQDVWPHWPTVIDIEGFVYEQPTGLRGDAGASSFSARDVDDLMKWVRRQKGSDSFYHAQPYAQLAHSLELVGRSSDANWVRFNAKKDEMLHKSTGFFRQLFMFTQLLLIGFGYYVQVSGIWLIILVYFGMKAVARDCSGSGRSFSDKLFFSLDMAIPIIELNGDKHKETLKALSKNNQVIIYLVKIFGFILITYFVAGLTGWVK